MPAAGVYLLLNTRNGKAYVGSTRNLRTRRAEHLRKLRRGEHHSAKLQNAWRKHGAEAFEFKVLAVVEPGRLLATEQHWIEHYDAARSGYNVMPKAGSAAGHRLSAAAKARMSVARKGRPLTLEHRQAIARARQGVPTGAQKPAAVARRMAAIRAAWTPERRQAWGERMRARWAANPDSRARAGSAMRGQSMPSATREKIAASQRGKVRSTEARRRVSDALRAAWARGKYAGRAAKGGGETPS